MESFFLAAFVLFREFNAIQLNDSDLRIGFLVHGIQSNETHTNGGIE